MWTEAPTDDIHRPMFTNEAGWTLYFWNGQSSRSIIARPNGTLWWWNHEFDRNKITEAQAWASEAIRRISA